MEDFNQTCNSTQKMFETLEGDFIALGNLLYDIKKKKQYRFRGYESFKEFVEMELLTSMSFANKLIRVYEMFVVHLDMSEADMKEIGFEKLSMVYPIFKKGESYKDAEFLKVWMEHLEIKTISELKVLIKQYKEAKKVLDANKEAIETGWTKACEIFNIPKKELILRLALLFLTSNDDSIKQLDITLKELKRKYEQQVQDMVDDNQKE